MTKVNNIEKAYDFDIPSDATLEDLEEIKAFEAWVMDGQPVED